MAYARDPHTPRSAPPLQETLSPELREPSFDTLFAAFQHQLATEGWTFHIIPHGDPTTPFGTQAHTHGLARTFSGQCDIQIVLPLAHDILHLFFTWYVSYLCHGGEPLPGQRITAFSPALPFCLAEAAHDGHRLWRVIFADEHGVLDRAQQAPPYSRQWEGTLDIPPMSLT